MYISPNNFMKNNAKPTFLYNRQFFGGTEYMAKNFHSKILPSMKNIQKYIALVFPGQIPENVDINNLEKDSVILWIHNLPFEFGPDFEKMFKEYLMPHAIKYLVVISEYQKEQILKITPGYESKIFVINNATDPVPYSKLKFDNTEKIKIIHFSEKTRGMEVLLNAISKIKDSNIEVNIFNDFYPDKEETPNSVTSLLDDERITFYGSTPRKTLQKFLTESHIHAYPSIFRETFCLAQVESLSAGCLSVYGNTGSLEEVSLGHGVKVEPNIFNVDEYSDRYAKELERAIKKIRDKEFDPSQQILDINQRFSWDVAKERWLELDKMLGEN